MTIYNTQWNGTTVDLKKVAYAMFFYRAKGKGIERYPKPERPTVNGQIIFPDEPALAHPEWPHETELARAKRLKLLDIWIPVWKCVLNNGHKLEYTYSKALSLNKAWNAMLFSRTKTKRDTHK